MYLAAKFEISDFILEDRTKIPETLLEHEVLGITIDTDLNKLNELTRIIPYLNKRQINLLYNSLFKRQIK